MSDEATLVARRTDLQGETIQRPITAEYDPSCKLVQFVHYGEEVFGTLEPVEPEEWQEIVDRLGQAAPFMRRVLVLVQDVERIANAAPGAVADELRGATARFAGSIDPEAVVRVAHAADEPEEDEPAGPMVAEVVERMAIAMCETGQVEWEVQEDHRKEYFRKLARVGLMATLPTVPPREVSAVAEEVKQLVERGYANAGLHFDALRRIGDLVGADIEKLEKS